MSLWNGVLGNLIGPADRDDNPISRQMGLWGVFQDEETLREGFEENREIILFLWTEEPNLHRPERDGGYLPGTRPGVWWRFESPEIPREDETEAECLYRLGLLEDRERELLKNHSSLRKKEDSR